MLSIPPLLFCLVLSLSAAASPVVVIRDSPINLPLFKRFNGLRHGRTLPDIDRAHIHAHGSRAQVPLSSSFDRAFYQINITIGSPPTEYGLLLDTGSSITWVGADKPYKRTRTSTDTGNTISFLYGGGEFSGAYYFDQVSLGNGLVIPHQGIGVANESSFSGVDGILGLGPVDLTVGSLTPQKTTSIPTVTDNISREKRIPNIVSVYLQPPTTGIQTVGSLTFGGVDTSKIKGPIHYIPRTKAQNSTLWWGIEQTLTYGKSTPIFAEDTAGILDTGTSCLLLNPDAFSIYQKATGGVLDNSTGLLSFTPEQFAKLQSLYFKINGVTFEFTADAQIFPRQFNTLIGGKADGIYGIVADLGIPRPVEPIFNSAFVNGMVFLERFYSVYDTENDRLGLAETAWTHAKIN